MAQPNPPGRKQGEDLLTEDPEYKRKDRTEQSRTEQNRTNENEDVTYKEDRKENYNKGDIQKDGRQVQRSKDENSVDDDEDEVL